MAADIGRLVPAAGRTTALSRIGPLCSEWRPAHAWAATAAAAATTTAATARPAVAPALVPSVRL